MAEKDYESPPEAPHFTTDEASSAGAEDKPSIAPDKESADSPEGKGNDDDHAPDDVEVKDAITETAIHGPS